jgi:putative glutamine amidotransferase
MRPIIGIPTQTMEPIPGQTPLTWIMGQRYVRALTQAGAVPWLVPLLTGDEPTLRAIYAGLDGIFLTGGVDVDPASYAEERYPQCGKTDPARDWAELHFVRWAMADHKPILGVCRGVQVLNVALGGTLYQDVATQYTDPIKHDYFPGPEKYTRDMIAHEVKVVRPSRLGDILDAEQAAVNSMHHQGIKCLADRLVATAWAPDGLIEGVEGRNGQYLVGVQWHPEELTEKDAAMKRLFASFIDAAAAYHQEHQPATAPAAP